MHAAGRTIHVAGAGISGLTLALALAKFGARVVVIERSRAIQEYGAGLQVSPNARHVLDRLGLDEALSALSFEPKGIDVYRFGAERPLVTLELGELMRRRFSAPYAVMHRADLVEILYRACRRFANIEIVFGVDSIAAETTGKGAAVTFSMAGNPPRQGRGFAFVGADGVHSETRTRALRGPAADRLSYTAWRTLLPLDALGPAFARERTSLLLGPGFHAVLYPLPHRDKLNVVAFSPMRERAGQGARPDMPAAARRSPLFAQLLNYDAEWGLWPLATVEAACWHAGNIGLMGDAAHAMLPFQAQGAAMAIEDAAILAPLLVTEPSAESAFRRYEAVRRPRVARVARLSRSNGRAFHLPWPASRVRDAVIAAQGARGHLARLGWLYGYDAAPGIAPGAAQRSP